MLSEKNKDLIDINESQERKVVQNMLINAGITNYDPNVIQRLINLTCDHVINILDNAMTLSKHANKNEVDNSDIILALKMRKENDIIPISKETISELASEKNNEPLPEIKQQNGIPLPPEKYCLSNTNYKLMNKPKVNPTIISQNSSLLVPTCIETNTSRTILKRPRTTTFPEQRIVFRPNLKINVKSNVENPIDLKIQRTN